MKYVLINGKRYYQDSRGNISLDNVSQEEANRREKRDTSSSLTNRDSQIDTSPHVFTNENITTTYSKQTVHWRIVAVIVVAFMVIGAFIYNQSHVSLAEKRISDYMEKAVDTTESLEENVSESTVENAVSEMAEDG